MGIVIDIKEARKNKKRKDELDQLVKDGIITEEEAAEFARMNLPGLEDAFEDDEYDN